MPEQEKKSEGGKGRVCTGGLQEEVASRQAEAVMAETGLDVDTRDTCSQEVSLLETPVYRKRGSRISKITLDM